VWLALAHPHLPSCEDCIRFLYGRDGTCRTKPENSPDPGHRVRRTPGTPLPCYTCPKIPAARPPVPASAVELDERGRRALQHYQRCRAVNWNVPDASDPLVQQHAAIIRAVEDMIERQDEARQLVTLGRMIRDRDK
jgi:hypothetical protein